MALPDPAILRSDQQRPAQAGHRRSPLPPTIIGDKARLNRVVSTKSVPKPVVVAENTWVIRGKDDTYLGFAFGDGRQSHETKLYDYMRADRVPHLGNYILSLTGVIPDAIGIDISASIGSDVRSPLGSCGLSAQGGLNLIWHTRGEGNRAWYPQVHIY